MEKSFNELRERLLHAGVAPRHVRRYLTELAEHHADLIAEQERAGLNPTDAQFAALGRLGSTDDLANALIRQRHFQSWAARAPLAVFGVAPMVLLAAAWFAACFILWSGWQIFLPSSATPFVPVDGLAVLYFGVGRLLYFAAPLVVGWAICITAARQRLRAYWPLLGLALIAITCTAFQVHVNRPGISGTAGQVSMGLAAGPWLSSGLAHALVYFTLMALPYLVWLLRKTLSSSVS